MKYLFRVSWTVLEFSKLLRLICRCSFSFLEARTEYFPTLRLLWDIGKQYQTFDSFLTWKTAIMVFIFYQYYSASHPTFSNLFPWVLCVWQRFPYSLKKNSLFQFISSLGYFWQVLRLVTINHVVLFSGISLKKTEFNVIIMKVWCDRDNLFITCRW